MAKKEVVRIHGITECNTRGGTIGCLVDALYTHIYIYITEPPSTQIDLQSTTKERQY